MIGDVAIFNEYGPTEAVVGCMLHRFAPSVDAEHDRRPDVPIGRPAPGVELFVRDEHGNLVPEGIAGELYIARPGLTDGYLHRDDLNAERFVDGPPGVTTPARTRAYRSGDLVRFIDATTLEYLGRIDEQTQGAGRTPRTGRGRSGADRAPAIAVGGGPTLASARRAQRRSSARRADSAPTSRA